MTRKSKRCPKQCKKHGFLLKPVHYSAVFSRELSASFCPPSLRALSITPRFNKDNRHFTISFLLPSDYKKILRNEEFYKTEHEKCRLENCGEKSKLYVAKPRSKSSYCSVCKLDYDDYLQHIRQENHKETIKNNRFNVFIEELSEQINRKIKEEEMRNEETNYHHFSQTNLPFFTQENTHFQEKSPFEQHCDYLQGFEYKQINELLHSAKNFQLLNEPHSNMQPQHYHEKQGAFSGLPVLALKNSCEPLDGGRMTTNVKPIIIGRTRNNQNLAE